MQLQAPILALELADAILQRPDSIQVGLRVRGLSQNSCQLKKGLCSLLA